MPDAAASESNAPLQSGRNAAMLHLSLNQVRQVNRADAWDDLIGASPGAHLLQSYGWGDFRTRYGWSVQRFAVATGDGFAAAQVLWRSTPLGPMGYMPRGPVVQPAANLAAVQRLFEGVHQAARAKGAVLLKVEPNNAGASLLLELKFRHSPETVQPKATLIIDLAQDLDALAASQHQKTRYNIRLAAKKGVEVRSGNADDLPAFCRLVDETGRRDGFAVRPASYYRDVLNVLGDRAELLVAEHGGDLLAGIVVASFNGEAIYLYGASSSQKRNLMPTYLLQWEAMRRAKDRGLVRYDLWGVPHELADLKLGESDPLPEAKGGRGDDLWGVYRFKRGFGGKLVSYCGAYDYVYSAPRYWVWERLLPVVRRQLRGVRGGAVE